MGSVHFDRHYFGHRYFLSFPAGTKMFQFPALAPHLHATTGLQPAGLPHSDTSGSIPVCRSPEIFAAYHVFRRLQKPRHPPFALVLLTRMNYFAFEIVVPNSIDLKTNGITDHLFRFFCFCKFYFTSLSISQCCQRTEMSVTVDKSVIQKTEKYKQFPSAYREALKHQ